MNSRAELSTTFNSIQQRALELLGSGVAAEMVASAIGVTPSYISQLISDPIFSEEVSKLRYENLQKHNVRDSNYDKIEDMLLAQLEVVAPTLHRPMEIARVLQTVNAAKRRGASTPDSVINKQTHISLIMPTQVLNKFTSNVNNQIISVAGQELLTIDSKSLLAKVGRTDDSTNTEETRAITSST